MQELEYTSDCIKVLKQCNEVEFRKDFDFGIVFDDPGLISLLKQGLLQYFEERRIKARAELTRLN